MKKQNLPIIIALSALSVTSFGCCSCFGLNLLFHDDTASDVSAPIVVTTTKPPTSAPTTATSTEPLILELPTEPPSKPITELSVTFLDVGQGDAAFIGCDGHYMLIDGGDTDSSSKMYSVMPEYAVISVGKNNEYGHPTDTVLSRLHDAETIVLNTTLPAKQKKLSSSPPSRNCSQ